MLSVEVWHSEHRGLFHGRQNRGRLSIRVRAAGRALRRKPINREAVCQLSHNALTTSRLPDAIPIVLLIQVSLSFPLAFYLAPASARERGVACCTESRRIGPRSAVVAEASFRLPSCCYTWQGRIPLFVDRCLSARRNGMCHAICRASSLLLVAVSGGRGLLVPRQTAHGEQ